MKHVIAYSTKPGKKRLGMYSTTSFTEGISTIRLMLNGRQKDREA